MRSTLPRLAKAAASLSRSTSPTLPENNGNQPTHAWVLRATSRSDRIYGAASLIIPGRPMNTFRNSGVAYLVPLNSITGTLETNCSQMFGYSAGSSDNTPSYWDISEASQPEYDGIIFAIQVQLKETRTPNETTARDGSSILIGTFSARNGNDYTLYQTLKSNYPNLIRVSYDNNSGQITPLEGHELKVPDGIIIATTENLGHTKQPSSTPTRTSSYGSLVTSRTKTNFNMDLF